MISGLPELYYGLQVTVAASLLAIVLGLIIGVMAGVGSLSRSRLLRSIIAVYVSIIRGTPLYIQILVIYFLFPAVGLDLPRLTTGVIALALNSGAYISQMVVGAVSAIPKGHLEAARALGIPAAATWRRIIVPQALRLMVPPLTIEFTALVKNSAFLSVIGVIELTRTAQQIISVTFKPIETWLVAATMYFVVCFALSSTAALIERKTAVRAIR